MFVTSRHSEYFDCEGAKSVFKIGAISQQCLSPGPSDPHLTQNLFPSSASLCGSCSVRRSGMFYSYRIYR
ncbi:hypothetical protein FJT64_013241 [Amphibalanus amphitrite]|uniref:Uncharacterized protein n=1 Tax=Amphibalanus amphitrite TaxID=1232801 RepID=A0A6A4UX93_AMPAM|nr:hypothetical protein FJT64_013241 [Amphibalanus amphitrite]